MLIQRPSKMTHDRDQIWRSADGRRIRVGDMEDSHLINVINWIIDNKKFYPDYLLPLMIAEAQYRQTTSFAEGKSYPQKVGRRWMLIDPTTGEGTIAPPPAEYIEAVKDNEAYQAMKQRTQEKRQKEM